VQSTSYNRKLIGGTRFLYEVEDWDRGAEGEAATTPATRAKPISTTKTERTAAKRTAKAVKKPAKAAKKPAKPAKVARAGKAAKR
jgi:hypothetical protein